jgi:uncharacterized membrane protein YfcA
MESDVIVAVNGILAMAAFFSSLTGFGYALIATPFLVLIFPPAVAVPLVLATWVPLSVFLAIDARREMSPRRIGNLLLGSAMGVPLGVYLLTSLGVQPLQLGIGSFTLLAAGILIAGPIPRLPGGRALCIVGGMLSGVSGGATAMSGPPVILLGLNQGWEPRSFRADLIGYFTVLHVAVLLILRASGVFDASVLSMGLASLPGVFVGYVVGIRAGKKMSGRLFRVAAIALVTLGGTMVLAEALAGDIAAMIAHLLHG